MTDLPDYYHSSRASVLEPRQDQIPTCVHCGKTFDTEGQLYRHYGGCY